MNYNAQFVNEVLENFHNSFMAKKRSWCDIASIEPEGDNYKKKLYQLLYTLRYFPAYYLEYCVLADALRQRVSGKYNTLNVASFGCGVCTDYYALKDNLAGVKFQYVGYDRCEWSSQKYLPEISSENFSFEFFVTHSFELGDLDDVDVFVFPKSIGDIAAGNGLEHLANVIASTKKEKIFFLNSYVSNGSENMSSNAGYFKVVHNALESEGFITNDKVNAAQYKGQFGAGLRSIEYDFCYPEKYLITCDDQGTKTLCSQCGVVKRPVMTNRFMEYQILEYVRE